MIKKINKKIFLSGFNIFNLILFLLAYKNLNEFSYLVFSIVSILSINYFVKFWKFYSELFLNIFIYLGFWFKFSINISISQNKQIAETNKFLSEAAIENNYFEVLNIISLSIFSITLFFFLFKKISFRITKQKNPFVFLNFVLKKYENFFFISFLIFFSIIIFLNSYFDFAFLGQQTSGFFFIEKLFKYLLMILFPLLIALIIDVYFKIHGRSLILIMFVIISFFCISLTLDSRALIIILFPILLVYFRYFNYTKLKLKSLSLMFGTFFIGTFSLFVILFMLVDQSRTRSHEAFSLNKSIKTINHIKYLVANRWVGIAGIVNVQYTKNKNIDMFVESLSEHSRRFNHYERNYFYSQNKSEPNFKSEDEFQKNFGKIYKHKHISVYTPGFMAFFYYSGSIIILLSLNLLLVLFLILLEKIYSILIGYSEFFLAMSSMILVWRIVHLGLFPSNSLLFFLILILTPITFLIIDKLFFYLIEKDK